MWSLIQNLKIFSANHTELYLAGVTLFFMLGGVRCNFSKKDLNRAWAWLMSGEKINILYAHTGSRPKPLIASLGCTSLKYGA